MKFGVSSYSFQKLINSGEMTQADCVEKAKELGFDEVEFIDLSPEEGFTEMEYAKHIRDRAEKAGIKITAYTVGACLIKDTDEELEAEIERVCRKVDVAEALGVKLMRHDAYFAQNKYRSFDLALPELANNIRRITEYAEKKGIRTMIENHGRICQGSERVEKIFNAVNHPNFGLLCDMGNFLCVDEDPAMAVSRVAPLAFHVHVKDFHILGYDHPAEGCLLTRACNKITGAPAGYGNVPVAQCIDILKAVGYDGAFSLEYECAEPNIEGIKKALAYLKSLDK